MKKILLGISALMVALAVVPLFAAFEAHVINVTAKIENALSVPLKSIDFGTVFPQEHLDKPLSIALSQSFLDERRVDDVEYIIRQKPKCGVTTDKGTVLVGPTATGHVSVDASGAVVIDCGPDPRELDTSGNPLPVGSSWGVLPSLCEYISKEGPDTNDGDLASFHKPYNVSGTDVIWNDVHGRLAKSDTDTEDTLPGDTVDTWTIDLAVPCFGGYCAQDWADFVHGINPDAGDPAQYTQDIDNEHKVFGCDLWVEVTGVSEFAQPEE